MKQYFVGRWLRSRTSASIPLVFRPSAIAALLPSASPSGRTCVVIKTFLQADSAVMICWYASLIGGGVIRGQGGTRKRPAARVFFPAIPPQPPSMVLGGFALFFWRP